jgi:hypothetical protein
MHLIKGAGRANEYKVPAWAVMEVDGNGKAHINQSGHSGIDTGTGALLGLVGGRQACWCGRWGGADRRAGKYFGHQFDLNALETLTVDMGPNTSAILVVVEDKLAEQMANSMDRYEAKVFTVVRPWLTLGDLKGRGLLRSPH